MSNYFSFLICDHGEIVNLYYNGIPLGTITDGEFKAREGLQMENLPQPCPFKTRDDLVDRIYQHLRRLQIPHREPPKK